MNKMEKALALFDAFNRQDPNEITFDGVHYPTEYFYALQLFNTVKELSPHASEILLLASRCQHIGRWTIPRQQYPEGKAGYIRWRTELAKFHAEKAGELMKEAGYDDTDIHALQRILLKEHLRTDPDVQVMEDALCLVFLRFQYEGFLHQHDEETLVRILQRTWKKMSPSAQSSALAISFSAGGKRLIEKAVGTAK